MAVTRENQLIIDNEIQVHGDIVQGNFIDSCILYYNITLKGFLALKWITMYCPNAEYMNEDEYVVVNTMLMINVIQNQVLNTNNHAKVLYVLSK